MRKTVIYLFHALVLLVPLFFSSKTDELFEFNKIILTYLIAALILGAWLARMILEKKWIFKRTPFDLPIVLFLASQIISTLFSMHMRTSWFGYYSRFNGGLLSIFTYVMLFYALISNIKKEEVKAFLNTMLYGAFATALYAIPEHFGHSFSCSMITQQFNDDCWIQDVRSRIFGTFGQPNWLAAYMLMMIPISITFLLENWKKPFQAFLYGIFTVSYFLTILFTASRSGFFALAMGLLFFAVSYLVFGLKRHRDQFKQHLVPAVIMLVVFVVLFQIFGAAFTPSINATIEKFQHVTGISLPRKGLSQQAPATTEIAPAATNSAQPAAPVVGTQLEVGGSESGLIRSIVWRGAINVWKSNPKNWLIGSGVETFAYSYYQQRPIEHNMVSEWDFLYNKAHNEFINYLATTGILGLGTYVLMIAWVYGWTFWMLWKKKEVNPILPLAWLSSYTALHISNFLGFSTVMVSVLFYLLPAFIWLDIFGEQDVKTKQRDQEISSGQIIGVGVVFFFVLYLLFAITKWWRADVAFATAKTHVQQQQALPAIQSFEQAISLSPKEALFHDEYATTLANIASGLAQQGQASSAAQFAQKSLQQEDITFGLNQVHLNFFKSRARIFIILSDIDPELLKEADTTFGIAEKLSPTDPKLYYNQAVVRKELGKPQEALELLRKALQLKPDYGAAVNEFASLSKKTASPSAARDKMPTQ